MSTFALTCRGIAEQPTSRSSSFGAAEEFRRRLALALAEREDLEAARERIAWFKRCYPTVKERFD